MPVDETADNQQLRAALADLRPRLHRFALGLSGSAHEADDLVQAGYERALSRLHQWQRGTRLDSWMYRIIQNLHFNRLRSERTRQTHCVADLDSFATSHDSSDDAIAQITLEKVRRCVWQLPAEQRACLLLVVVEGLSYKETAAVLELPLGTVTSRLSRARAQLLQMLDGQLGEH